MSRITVEAGAMETILPALGLDTDDDDYVVDAETEERITTPDGHEIPISRFGGVTRQDGERVYVRDSFPDLVSAVERNRDDERTQDSENEANND